MSITLVAGIAAYHNGSLPQNGPESTKRGGRDSFRGEKRIWILEGPPLEDIVDIEELLAPLKTYPGYRV